MKDFPWFFIPIPKGRNSTREYQFTKIYITCKWWIYVWEFEGDGTYFTLVSQLRVLGQKLLIHIYTHIYRYRLSRLSVQKSLKFCNCKTLTENTIALPNQVWHKLVFYGGSLQIGPIIWLLFVSYICKYVCVYMCVYVYIVCIYMFQL